MKKEDVIELSHRMIAGKENFKLEIRIDDIAEVRPSAVHTHSPDVWYTLGETTLCTHAGTHIEMPYHHLRDGLDIADFPVYRLIGDGVVMNFSEKKADEAITLVEVKKYQDQIHEGSFVFIWNGMDKFHRTKQWMQWSYLTEEATNWLIEKKIACIGTDAPGLEVPADLPKTQDQPNHTAFFKANIPIIESLTNLGKIENGKYLVIVLPLPIEGLDASPLRVIAINKEALRNELR